MQDMIKRLEKLLGQIQAAQKFLNLADDERVINSMEESLQDPQSWNNHEDAAAVSKKIIVLKKRIDSWNLLEKETEQLLELAKLQDKSMEKDLKETYDKLENQFNKRQFELKLAGPYDKNSAILSIHAGTGGTDAQDWAEMLMRMYLRYCEQTGYTTDILNYSKGEEAGIKSAVIEVSGQFAYGRLKSEYGVHRLVRQSPFNAKHLRQTSFALIEVLPEAEGPTEIEIDSGDLKIDVFRSSGHGGQSVNTTDSAVRLTHLPTGLVVTCQDEKSQLKNKQKAMKVLKARLLALMIEQHKSKISELKVANLKAEWGSQIRSYVLHPYSLVKDHRTNYETAKVDQVLGGDLEPLIEAYLGLHIGEK